MAATNEPTLRDIYERQERLQTGLIVLSSQFEEVLEALGGENVPAKFRSRQQFIEAIAKRARRTQAASGLS